MKINFAYRMSQFTSSWINGKNSLWIIVLANLLWEFVDGIGIVGFD